jgi:hypothetical protein
MDAVKQATTTLTTIITCLVILLAPVIGSYVAWCFLIDKRIENAKVESPEPESEVFVTVLRSTPQANENAKYLPNPSLTPGAVFKGIGQTELSKVGYSATVRNVPLSVKKEVMKRYGMSEDELHNVEIDHLISLECGGSNDIRNLWPQPYDAHGTWGARHKDVLENRIHKMIVSGEISVPDGQHMLANHWHDAYEKLIEGKP